MGCSIGKRIKQRVLTDREKAIYEYRMIGLQWKDIAEKYGISITRARQLYERVLDNGN